MNVKRMALVAVLAVAVISLTIPLVGVAARAGGRTADRISNKGFERGATSLMSTTSMPAVKQEAQRERDREVGAMDPEVKHRLGIDKPEGFVDSEQYGKKIAKMLEKRIAKGSKGGGEDVSIQSGEPVNMCAGSALSAALITTEGGRDTQFSEVLTLGDWDGREDCAADHSGKVDDFSSIETEIDQSLTRAAISEHTIANGFAEDIFYYGDSIGNLYVSATTNLTQAMPTPQVLQINLPTVLNAFGTLNSDDQVVITGLAVNPVADLGSFARVNGAFSSFNGLTGEILYVSFTDTESGFRLLANGTLIRSGVLAFPIADIISAAAAPPGILSNTGFPVQVGGAFGVAFSVFDNVAGVACDDDGSIYFQQVDLVQFTGGNIVKITGTDVPGVPGVVAGFQDRSLATNGFFTLATLNPTNGAYGTASGPANQVNRATNYSGTSGLFGDIEALSSGNCNVLYAAVAKSNTSGLTLPTDITEGFFAANTTAFPSGTPSMVISFADCAGATAFCSLPQNPVTGAFVQGVGLPIADGFADPSQAGIPLAVPPASPSSTPTLTPGVNNFRVFVLGTGPDIRTSVAPLSSVTGTSTTTQKVDFQVDPTIHNGITVDENATVYVVSGGTPAGISTNPSPRLGEILCFEDKCPADRRGDFTDLRGAGTLPNPPNVGNTGDGLDTRTDHIYWQAPLDAVTQTPTGIAGLARGFLRYTNRLAPLVPIGKDSAGNFVTLGTTDRTLGDDDTTHTATGPGVITGNTGGAPIVFEMLDPCHQVAGGDDQVFPFTGDDDNGAGSPVVTGPLSGGFEFLFANPLGDVTQVGAACGTGNGVWNGVFWNSNGNVTFGSGDLSNIADVVAFRSGLPKIAPAWADLNPGSRQNGFLNTFPVQALGFAGVNSFKLRSINVPEFGNEACNSSNTFSITLFDDGTGIDENASQPLNPANPIGNNAVPFDLLEGATANRFTKEPNTGVIVGCPPRRDGTGIFAFEYCRMDLLGTSSNPVIAGFSIGRQNGLNPPGLCETNLSVVSAAADTGFGVLDGQVAAVGCNCCIGEGTEPTIFELFNEGRGGSIGSGGEVTFSTPDFDLRFEGNDPALCTSTRQRDFNRGHVCFYGTTCQLPPNPTCLLVIPQEPGQAITAPIVVAPGQPAVGTAAAATPNGAGVKVASPTAGIINALCAVQLDVLGCGFFPNEVTTICQGFSSETGIPLLRPGKTVTTSEAVNCDTNGDGVPDLAIVLTNVTPKNCNLVTGVVAPLANAPGTGFPLACCGGFATLTTTERFTNGDNNIFNLLTTGGFTRTTTCVIDLGLRAPVVVSVTPATGACGVLQDELISGACFIINGVPNVTSVFAIDRANPATRIDAQVFFIVNANLIDATFNFTSANAGKTFLVFVSGPNGTSRNLTTAVAGAPAGCPLGNELGVQVTFTCNAAANPNPGGTPDIAVVTGCHLDRQDNGTFFLDVTGTNIKDGATATVGGVTPKKIKVVEVAPGTTNPTKLRLIKKVCNGLPGNVIITNPGPNGAPSQPFNCTERCPAQ